MSSTIISLLLLFFSFMLVLKEAGAFKSDD